jgi:hypothetical protein
VKEAVDAAAAKEATK